jgi:hypothetical protein
VGGNRFVVLFMKPAADLRRVVYAALFDNNFLPLGPAQRLCIIDPSDPSSSQLFTHHGPFHAPWEDAFNGELERLERDQQRDHVEKKIAASCPSAIDALVLSPNPCHGRTVARYNVRSDAAQSAVLRVYDALGRAVMGMHELLLPSGAGSHQLDFTGLPSGMYHVSLAHGNTVIRKSVIVQH